MHDVPGSLPVRDQSTPVGTGAGAVSNSDLERAIVDAVTGGALEVAQVLAARLAERKRDTGNVVDLAIERARRHSACAGRSNDTYRWWHETDERISRRCRATRARTTGSRLGQEPERMFAGFDPRGRYKAREEDSETRHRLNKDTSPLCTSSRLVTARCQE